MASISPLSSTNVTPRPAEAAVVKQTQPTVSPKPAATLQRDTVKLSAAAQAKLLHRQGQTVGNIAAALGTDAKTIDGYLGVTVNAGLEKALQAATAKA